MTSPLRIFIGYDEREVPAYHVLAHSIIRSASAPVLISALALRNLDGYMWRDRDPNQSTDFAFSRFLVPALCGYEGYAIFMDCDMMLREGVDIHGLLDYIDQWTPVAVCHHDYTPSTATKMEGMSEVAIPQTAYPMKNWSSLMVFNNALCRSLTAGYVNQASGMDLHRFRWMDGEPKAIPLEWNWLVGEYEYNISAKNVHWTLGGPWLYAFQGADYATEWFTARDEMMRDRSVRSVRYG